MTILDFCAALLGSTAAYILGDAIWAWGARRGSAAAQRSGAVLIAVGAAVLVGLVVWMVQAMYAPISAVWGVLHE